jgi:hypothetical protein
MDEAAYRPPWGLRRNSGQLVISIDNIISSGLLVFLHILCRQYSMNAISIQHTQRCTTDLVLYLSLTNIESSPACGWNPTRPRESEHSCKLRTACQKRGGILSDDMGMRKTLQVGSSKSSTHSLRGNGTLSRLTDSVPLNELLDRFDS